MLVLSSSSSSYTIIITGVLPSPSLSRHRGFPSSRRLCLVGQLPPVVRLELKTGRSMPPCITDCVGRHVSYAEILIFCATCCAFTEEAKEVLSSANRANSVLSSPLDEGPGLGMSSVTLYISHRVREIKQLPWGTPAEIVFRDDTSPSRLTWKVRPSK